MALAGTVQKGPFVRGCAVTVQELDSTLAPTGRTFQVTTNDDEGDFSIPVNVSSQFVELIASGYYFDELTNHLSSGQLTLHALADLTGGGTVNVNLLTSMSEPLARKLVANGSTFSEATSRAESAVLGALGFAPSSLGASFSSVGLTGSGSASAEALAASLIVQQYASSLGSSEVAQLSQLLGQVGAAAADSGGDATLGAMHAALCQTIWSLDTGRVRSSLASYYASLGASVTVPPFEQFLCGCGIFCGATCVNTQIDVNNCGACGTACPATATCEKALCVCPAGQVLSNGVCCPSDSEGCGGACVDTRTDANHCGGCGTACSGAGALCLDGGCINPTGGATNVHSLCSASASGDPAYGLAAAGTSTIVVAGVPSGSVTSYDSSCNVNWRTGAGMGALGVATDSIGAAYVAGFSGTSPGFAEMAKFDSAGAPQWQKTFPDPSGSGGESQAVAIQITQNGESAISGWFNGQIDFGKGTMTGTAGTNGGAYSTPETVFLARFDAGGSPRWSKKITPFGATTATNPGSLVMDPAGRTGVSMDTSPAIQAFLEIDDSGGNVAWSKTLVGVQRPLLAFDPSGNLFLSGVVRADVAVDLGSGALGSMPNDTLAIAKYDASGTLLWSQFYPSFVVRALATDASGNLFATGFFQGILDLGTGPLADSVFANVLVAKFNAGGSIVWARAFNTTPYPDGGTAQSFSEGFGIGFDSSGTMLFIGDSQNVLLDLGAGPIGYTTFFARLTQ